MPLLSVRLKRKREREREITHMQKSAGCVGYNDCREGAQFQGVLKDIWKQSTLGMGKAIFTPYRTAWPAVPSPPLGCKKNGSFTPSNSPDPFPNRSTMVTQVSKYPFLKAIFSVLPQGFLPTDTGVAEISHL